MGQLREAVNSVTVELTKLQETLKSNPSDLTSSLSATQSHLARINVWAVSTGLADPPRSKGTSYWPKVSLSMRTHVRSLLDDFASLCGEGKLLTDRYDLRQRKLKTVADTH